MQPLLLITGPTGSGKTDISVEVARRFDTEIISADSVQVYRGFDIGSGKITEAEKRGIRHHLIDTKNPKEPYSAAIFHKEAQPIIDALSDAGKLPIVAGGTALYIHGLLYQLDFNDKPDPAVRNAVRSLYEKRGLSFMAHLLREKDPETAAKTDLNNPRRVLRALEQIKSGGKKTENLRKKRVDMDPLYIVLDWEREELYDRINRRVLGMVRAGLFEEVRALYARYKDEVKPMGAIGYKEIVAYYKGEWDRETAIQKVQQHSRNLAKRQCTWFRRETDAIFIPMSDLGEKEAIEKIIQLVKEKYGSQYGYYTN